MQKTRCNTGRVTLGALFFLAVWFISALHSFAQIPEEPAIRYVKRLPVVKLDSTLNTERFSAWLGRIAGQTATLRWELNDCGEQTGVPAIDTARDLPACVGVYAQCPGHRNFGITIGVGTLAKGVTGPPGIYDIYLESAETTRTFRSLRELRDALKILPTK